MSVRKMAAGAEGSDHALERLVFFSDAVFAIAITLLVIDLHVPHVAPQSGHAGFINALLHMAPNFLGFFISFWVIGAFWGGHHRAFALAAHYSPGLMGPNLTMLCAVAFLPFTTAFMASYLGALVPTAIYNLSLVVTGLLNLRLVRMVTSPPVVSPAIDHATIMLTRARGWGVTLGSLCALILTFVDSRFSPLALLTIPIWMRLAAAQTRRRLAAKNLSS